MPQKDADFLKKLLATFKVEAEEHLKALSSGLLELEKSPDVIRQTVLIETIFREAHSLKGAARSVNVTDMEAVCQSLESVLSKFKRREITASPEVFDLFHRIVNGLGEILSGFESARTPDLKLKTEMLTQELEKIVKAAPLPARSEEPKTIEPKQPILSERPSSDETIRISVTKLDSVLLQAEELLSAKLAAGERARKLREVGTDLAAWKKEWAKVHSTVRTIRPSSERNGSPNGSPKKDPQVSKLLEWLDRDSTRIQSLESKLAALTLSADQDQRSLTGMVDHLLEDTKKILMFPFSSLLEIFPKLVRDLSRDRGKEVELVIQGAEIEIDRRILEEIKDPLVHLVRNGIDHGIEKPAEREQKRKSPRGTMTIAVSQRDGGKVEILVTDDGTGIDVAKVRSAVQRLGLVSPEETERLGEQEVAGFIFQSGVSTSPIVTDLSGRGLGLAIVREKVEKLGGVVTVETHAGVGTTFRMVLPLTLATFRGIIVRVEDHLFVLRTTHVERAGRVGKEEIKTVENRETIPLDGQAVSLVRLGDVLGLSRKRAAADPADSVPIVVLDLAGKRVAFQVDEVLDEREVLVKSLGRQLPRVRNIAGATVLGTGQVAPILNVQDLMKSAVKSAAAPVRAAEETTARRKSVLVAEDSITARTLVKNILESAGYHVKTAVDGVEALTALKTELFDLVVSDVDMPRMSGFDLTAKIRADKKLSELPVVLVTALESREDRERGIDVGANAYIVKSSFDQSNLLEVIRRLV
ncbi:MAG TPA: hybrid sensor histidine kinase/response regulator [Nitrospiria bacterium]